MECLCENVCAYTCACLMTYARTGMQSLPTHPPTHTHTHPERERGREREKGGKVRQSERERERERGETEIVRA
jgi:hypothetical protein